MDLSALAGRKPGRAISGLTSANVAVIQSGLGAHRTTSQIVRPCVPSRDTALGSAFGPHRWQTGSTLFHAWNKVPSRSMACIMTANRRASATRAFLKPRRFTSFIAHVFSAKVSWHRDRIEFAAS